MKQFTTIDYSIFQTITTLETECCRCHAITRHVAHATMIPPYEKGIKFDGDAKEKAFIDFDKVLNHQCQVMESMRNTYAQNTSILKQEINFLREMLSKFPPLQYADENE